VTVKLYADRPRRGLAQVTGDVLALGWTALWIRAGFAVHDAVQALAVPGRKLEDAGSALEQHLRDAATTAARVPLVGEELRSPFDAAAGAGHSLADAGRDQQHVVGHAAVLLGVVTVVVPLVLALWWLVHRIRWVREATAATRMLAGGVDPSLFALRALATQPLRRLRSVSPDPVRGWREGDAAVVGALAELQLARMGLRRR
jgi:hypothetical protein